MDEIRIANEFAVISVRPVSTGAGRRLELHSERSDRRVQLDATVLDGLCRLSPEQLTAVVAGEDIVE